MKVCEHVSMGIFFLEKELIRFDEIFKGICDSKKDDKIFALGTGHPDPDRGPCCLNK